MQERFGVQCDSSKFRLCACPLNLLYTHSAKQGMKRGLGISTVPLVSMPQTVCSFHVHSGVPPPEKPPDTGQQATGAETAPVATRGTTATTHTSNIDNTTATTRTSNNHNNTTVNSHTNNHRSNAIPRTGTTNNHHSNNSSWNQPSLHTGRNQPPKHSSSKRWYADIYVTKFLLQFFWYFFCSNYLGRFFCDINSLKWLMVNFSIH